MYGNGNVPPEWAAPGYNPDQPWTAPGGNPGSVAMQRYEQSIQRDRELRERNFHAAEDAAGAAMTAELLARGVGRLFRWLFPL